MELKSVFRNIFIVLSLVFLSLCAFSSIAKDIRSSMDDIDNPLTAWIIGWDIHALLTDPLNIFNANIFHPFKNALAYSDPLFSTALVAMPIFLATKNLVLTQNLIMLLSFPLTALGMYLLVYYYTKDRLISIIGAIIFAFAPYRFWNLAHLQNLTIWWIPFSILFLHKYFDTAKVKFLIAFSICLLMQILASWYHAVFVMMIVTAIFVWELWKDNWKLLSEKLKKFYVSILVVGVISFVFLIPHFSVYSQSGGYTIAEMANSSADALSFFIPSPNTFLGKAINVFQIKKKWTENFVYLGAVNVLIGTLFGIQLLRKKIKIDKRLIVYGILFVVALIFSLGPVLILKDHKTYIPLPYATLLTLFKYIGFVRVPARYFVVVLFAWSILISLGLNNLLQKFKYRNLLLIILGILIFLDFYPAANFARYKDYSKVPKVYEYIAEQQDDGAVLELPEGAFPGRDFDYVYFSSVHRHPLVNGYSGGYPEGYWDQMFKLNTFPSEESIETIHETGVKYVILHCKNKELGAKKCEEIVTQAASKQAKEFKRFENGDLLWVF